MVLYFVRQSVSPPADELLLASGAPYPRMWCDIPGSHVVHSSNLPGLESECPPDPLSTPSIPPSPPSRYLGYLRRQVVAIFAMIHRLISIEKVG